LPRSDKCIEIIEELFDLGGNSFVMVHAAGAAFYKFTFHKMQSQ